MKLTYAELSFAGPARRKNEDYLGFFHPDSEEEECTRGSIVLVADGVGGHGICAAMLSQSSVQESEVYVELYRPLPLTVSDLVIEPQGAGEQTDVLCEEVIESYATATEDVLA